MILSVRTLEGGIAVAASRVSYSCDGSYVRLGKEIFCVVSVMVGRSAITDFGLGSRDPFYHDVRGRGRGCCLQGLCGQVPFSPGIG